MNNVVMIPSPMRRALDRVIADNRAACDAMRVAFGQFSYMLPPDARDLLEKMTEGLATRDQLLTLIVEAIENLQKGETDGRA